jgi:hypothetical protein
MPLPVGGTAGAGGAAPPPAVTNHGSPPVRRLPQTAFAMIPSDRAQGLTGAGMTFPVQPPRPVVGPCPLHHPRKARANSTTSRPAVPAGLAPLTKARGVSCGNGPTLFFRQGDAVGTLFLRYCRQCCAAFRLSRGQNARELCPAAGSCGECARWGRPTQAC